MSTTSRRLSLHTTIVFLFTVIMARLLQLFRWHANYPRRFRSLILFDTCKGKWKCRFVCIPPIILLTYISLAFLSPPLMSSSDKVYEQTRKEFASYPQTVKGNLGLASNEAKDFATHQNSNSINSTLLPSNRPTEINKSMRYAAANASKAYHGVDNSTNRYDTKRNRTNVQVRSSLHRRDRRNLDGPPCPVTPPDLVGSQPVTLTACSDEVTTLVQASGVSQGGEWSPGECLAKYKVAIIVPVRDREEQVWVFLAHIHPFLQRQQLSYTIYIVEQAGTELFNRAKLLNVGFVEATRNKSFDCVLFHDVDMLPEDDKNLYHCSDMPRHMIVASSNDKYKSNLSFMRKSYYGGACMMTPLHVNMVNGWSNRYWGWGGEDDDMGRRIAAHDLPVWRYPLSLGRYTMIPHGPPPGINHDSYGDLKKFSPHHRKDGLNSLQYNLVSTTRLIHHTRILADIGSPANDKKIRKKKKVK